MAELADAQDSGSPLLPFAALSTSEFVEFFGRLLRRVDPTSREVVDTSWTPLSEDTGEVRTARVGGVRIPLISGSLSEFVTEVAELAVYVFRNRRITELSTANA